MAWTVSHPIVVPFDFSMHAKAALKQALTIAENPEQIHALHVLPFLIPSEPGVVWATVDDSSRIQHALENMNEALPVKEYGNIGKDVRLGDPGQIISDRAEELGADLIIVGSHGRTGLTRLVLGSVAERVTRLAHCPVLVVKLLPTAVSAAEPTAKPINATT